MVLRTKTLTNSPISHITVNGNLTINSGSLVDDGNTIHILKNVENNATHSSSNGTTGGMNFNGSAEQIMSGNGSGTFGNIIINNSGSKGIMMTDDSRINGQITFTSGYFYIDDYTLTLGTSATIAGTNNATNQIRLNGVVSDKGVVKVFPANYASSFTFPVGVAGKYTPVTYNFTSSNNAAGATIKVVPANLLHPTLNTSYSSYLNYYWNIVSTGFSSATYSVGETFTFIPADATGTLAGIERILYMVNYLWYSIFANIFI
jgi:hypothetical protein